MKHALFPAALLLAVGCCGAVDLRLERVSLADDKAPRVEDAIVVEVVADQDLLALQGPGRYVVNLLYNVDGRGPVRTGTYRYDPEQVVDRLPFGAVMLEPGENRDPRVTRWAIDLSSRVDRAGTVFEYTLEDAREHVLTLQVHGFKFPGACAWTSNAVELRIPRRRR